MKVIREITEAEMVAEFLRAEISSTRFGGGLASLLLQRRIDLSVVDSPDPTNSSDNEIRATLLAQHRGYSTNSYLFQGFPNAVVWKRVVLTRDDLRNVLYANHLPEWSALAGGSRRVLDGANGVRQGRAVTGITNETFKATAAAIQAGAILAAPILVTKNQSSVFVTMEGHMRLTAYLLDDDEIPEDLNVIIGFSDDIASWYWW
jgi:hypothetical protein